MSISEKTVHNISEYISSITDLKAMHNKLWFSYTINIQHLLSLVKLLNTRRIHRNVRL